jgi:hypothetical protein
MDWYSVLTPELSKAAYKSDDEMAWPRQEAIRVATLLQKNGHVVIGVDIWLPTQPGPTIPTPFVYDWSLRTEKPPTDYPPSAIEFIRSFAWDPSDRSHGGMEPYFNITARRSDS